MLAGTDSDAAASAAAAAAADAAVWEMGVGRAGPGGATR